MKKTISRIQVLMQKRSFWINTIGGLIIAANEMSGRIIPTHIAAEIVIILNIINRFIKVIFEEENK